MVQQTWSASDYNTHGRFVSDLTDGLFSFLNPKVGEIILDLGCGDGAFSDRIRRAGAVVVGIDSSPDMVAAARARGVDANLGDAHSLEFDNEFDAVVSNAALHWMRDQDAVLEGIHRALKSNGRFAAEMGAHGNIAAIRTALRACSARYGLDSEQLSGNYFFGAEEYGALLRKHKFHIQKIVTEQRPTFLPTGLGKWLRTFRRSFLEQVPSEYRETLISEVTELLKPILCDSTGRWYADYIRLRVLARKI